MVSISPSCRQFSPPFLLAFSYLSSPVLPSFSLSTLYHCSPSLPLCTTSSHHLFSPPLRTAINRGGKVTFIRALTSEQPYIDVAKVLVYRAHYSFVLWCGVWWACFLLLLAVHVYFMCYNLTSKEYVQGSEKCWYIGKKTGSLFSRRSVWANIRDRMFPLVDDVCYCKRDVVELLQRPVPPYRHYFSRFRAAFADIWNDKSVQCVTNRSDKEL